MYATAGSVRIAAEIGLLMERQMKPHPVFQFTILTLLCLGDIGAAQAQTVVADRGAAGRIELHWQSNDPMNIYVSDAPDAPIAAAREVAHANRSGFFRSSEASQFRTFFILSDEQTHHLSRVSERLVHLERGSNMRDLGGYPAAGGKTTRWGLIYRSAAMPLLTHVDYQILRRIGIKSDVDLRSIEERIVAPDLIPDRAGAKYDVKDYPASDIFSAPSAQLSATQADNLIRLYRAWPTSLSSQYAMIFQSLLLHQGASLFHCSAGQDRTGLASALVLSALGVPRAIILQDYFLSTADRQPENEVPEVDPARYPGNIIAVYYAKAQSIRGALKPKPLVDSHGTAYLQYSFDEIEKHWGSIDNYLRDILGMDASKIAALRQYYLE
jgi:protein-tyrosine phosphatase